MGLSNHEVLNETLVDRIFEKFENPKIDNYYNDQFLNEFSNVARKHNIEVEFRADDPYRTTVEGKTELNLNPKYSTKYILVLYVPQIQHDTGEKTFRETVNVLLHEFSRSIITDIIKKLTPNVKNIRVVERFTATVGLPIHFDINKVTKENSLAFLNYIFDIKERPIWAFSIAYSQFYHNKGYSIRKLVDINNKYIFGHRQGHIDFQALNNYIQTLKDDTLCLFEIQYTIYIIDSQRWRNKFESFINLIEKYRKRLEKRSQLPPALADILDE